MATTYTHTRISIVDSLGNIQVLYPQSTGNDVMINRTNVNVPVGVTNVQELVNLLGLNAFSSEGPEPFTSEIDDENISSSTTYSSSKIEDELTGLRNSFQDGCDDIVAAITAKGTTPESSSLEDIIAAIGAIETGGGTSGLAELITFLRNEGYNIPQNATVEDICDALTENPQTMIDVERYFFYKYASPSSTNINSTYLNYTEYVDHILLYGLKTAGLAAGDKTIYIPDYDNNGKQITIG